MFANREITISTAGSRKSKTWIIQKLMWSDFVERLKQPVRSQETLSEYMTYSKAKQDEVKDVGGYMAGALKDGRRKVGNILDRHLISLDLDNIPSGQTAQVLQRVEGLGCAYVAHSTRKHHEAKPRLRVLFVLDRAVAPDEYEPIARRVGQTLGIELCDPTTFQVNRLMFYPSCSSDSTYVFKCADKPFLSADGVLGAYKNWKDVTEWAQVPGMPQMHARLAAKQGDPLSKSGVVGAFCKTHNVYSVLDAFIPGTYEVCDTDEERLTFLGGSTTGGAVVYENGNFLFSHHATDPACGKLCNAFDLIRIHKFADLDDDIKQETPVNKLPSYTAMVELAVQDTATAALLNLERYKKATKDFDVPASEGDNIDWMSRLAVSGSTGMPAKTTDNVLLILDNDPRLKGRIAFDEFANRTVSLGALPWNSSNKIKPWSDVDDAGLRHYIERTQSISGRDRISDALMITAHKNRFDNVKEYLTRLEWDGVPRLDTLFVDYLGASDTIYTRAATRKSFSAAVARIMVPGTKFDCMLILTGPQGKGKSTLLKKMGRSWFSDSLKTFEGKEASELVQGVWIVEIGELEVFNKSEIGRIKQFLSQQEDIYRAAYGRHTQWCPRRCIFFGTSNNQEYLRDKTGNRRFWPMDILVTAPTKNVYTELDGEVDQLWAEAFFRWQMGEQLYLTGEAECEAIAEQEAHRENDAKEGLVRDFLMRRLPQDWDRKPLGERRLHWSTEDPEKLTADTVERDRVCALEIWCECLGGDPKYLKRADATDINQLLTNITGWDRYQGRYGCYGQQKGFKVK